MTIDINDLAARLAALEATVAALTTKAPKATVTPRKASETITFGENAIALTRVEGRAYALLAGKTMTRSEAIATLDAAKVSTRPANVLLYDACKAQEAALAKAAPVAPVVTPAPIIELVVEPTPVVVNETPAPVVDITPTAAHAAPKATRTRKAQGK